MKLIRVTRILLVHVFMNEYNHRSIWNDQSGIVADLTDEEWGYLSNCLELLTESQLTILYSLPKDEPKS